MHLVLGEDLLRLLLRDADVDDHIVALLPVHGRRDAVLVARLERVDDADDLVLQV